MVKFNLQVRFSSDIPSSTWIRLWKLYKYFMTAIKNVELFTSWILLSYRTCTRTTKLISTIHRLLHFVIPVAAFKYVVQCHTNMPKLMKEFPHMYLLREGNTRLKLHFYSVSIILPRYSTYLGITVQINVFFERGFTRAKNVSIH